MTDTTDSQKRRLAQLKDQLRQELLKEIEEDLAKKHKEEEEEKERQQKTAAQNGYWWGTLGKSLGALSVLFSALAFGPVIRHFYPSVSYDASTDISMVAGGIAFLLCLIAFLARAELMRIVRAHRISTALFVGLSFVALALSVMWIAGGRAARQLTVERQEEVDIINQPIPGPNGIGYVVDARASLGSNGSLVIHCSGMGCSSFSSLETKHPDPRLCKEYTKHGFSTVVLYVGGFTGGDAADFIEYQSEMRTLGLKKGRVVVHCK